MATSIPAFVVIDDDTISNTICEKLATFTFPGAPIHTFTNAALGLTHLQSVALTSRAILLLDVDMPDPTGWEVVDLFEQLPQDVRIQVKIIMLSSSVNPDDMDRARIHNTVGGYVLKPLSVTKLQTIVASLDQPYIDMSDTW